MDVGMMKVVVVYSGGLDSTVLLHHALQQYDDVEALTFNYGSKHNIKEINMAMWNTQKLQISHRIVRLDFIKENFKSDLLQGQGEIPEGHYAAENMKKTVVPLRNGIMLMIASGYAESIGAEKVLIASHAGDHFIYPDCRPEFNRALNLAIEYGTNNKVSIAAPFNKMMKWDIVKRGEELGVDWSKTWSCYKGEGIHCGKCGTCNERIEAFQKAGVDDPLMK